MAAFCARITGGRTCLPVSVSLDFQCNNLVMCYILGNRTLGEGICPIGANLSGKCNNLHKNVTFLAMRTPDGRR